MPPSFRKDSSVHIRAQQLLQCNWRPEAIARDARVCRSTAYKWERDLARYGQTTVPRRLYHPGRPRGISPAALDSLIEYQLQNPGFINKSWADTWKKSGICQSLNHQSHER